MLSNPGHFVSYHEKDMFRGSGFTLYSEAGNVIISFVRLSKPEIFKQLFKRISSKNTIPARYNLNLNKVKRLHGNNYIKRKYKTRC